MDDSDEKCWQEMKDVYDVAVIGGGINGSGIAVDAANRGLKTLLLESADFGSGTSSRSSKLIHGGLRYLEYYDFGLVRQALAERERLLRKARHIVWPLRFVMPVVEQSRPAWLVRLGLFLYDHLAPRKELPATEAIRLRDQPSRLGFRQAYDRAFAYFDCWVDDARLVIANLQGAAEAGAEILARTAFENADRTRNGWSITARADGAGQPLQFRATAIVNAAGPWAAGIADSVRGVSTGYSARLVRGSHIVVPRLYDGDHATLLQIDDGRIVLTMPYEDQFTLVGTTDKDHAGDPAEVSMTDDERDYLLAAANTFFSRQTSATDIRWSYAGVRPLFEEGNSRDGSPTTMTREYSFKIDRGEDGAGAPFLTVLGGKLTTYRRLAQHALDELSAGFPDYAGNCSTETSILPGANIGPGGPAAYAERLRAGYPWLPTSLRVRLARTYGTRADRILRGATAVVDLGTHFGGDLFAREVDYLIEHEWARTAEDVLWRRTKCGLQVDEDAAANLAAYMNSACQEDKTWRLSRATS